MGRTMPTKCCPRSARVPWLGARRNRTASRRANHLTLPCSLFLSRLPFRGNVRGVNGRARVRQLQNPKHGDGTACPIGLRIHVLNAFAAKWHACGNRTKLLSHEALERSVGPTSSPRWFVISSTTHHLPAFEV